jgi:UDP-GlcNAc:undecaprenyl-phosphate GlcNAc-1-phosphate transferase
MPHQLGSAILPGLTAFALAFVLAPLVRSGAVRFGWVARPVQDRWGRRAVARLGGIAMFAGFMVPLALWRSSLAPWTGLWAGMALVFALGLADDVRRIPAYTKLVGQLLVGLVAVIGGVRIELIEWSWLSIPLSVMWFVLIMNAFNLLDNMDGLAAGVGAIAASFCAMHAALSGEWEVMRLNVMLAAVCLGFLRWNFPPAKIYMGDAGSHFIGFSLAALSLAGTWRHSTQLLSVLAVPTLVLAVPIFDTCFVIIQRLAHRLHPFSGGTDHVSHRLAVLGLSTRQTVLVLYAVCAFVGWMSVMTARLSAPATVAIWLLVVTGLGWCGGYLARVKVYRLAAPAQASREARRSDSFTLIETMLMHKRRLLEVVLDFCLLSCAYVLAHLLRFEGMLTGDLQGLIVRSLPVLLAAKLMSLGAFGVYRGVWRYAGLPDLLAVFKAVTLGSLLSACALLYLWRFDGFSRSVLIIDWLLSVVLIGGARVTERLLDEWIQQAVGQGTPILIIGAGDTGARVLHRLRFEDRTRYRLVGFLDDDAAKWGTRIQGATVLGSRHRLATLLGRHGIGHVFVAIGDPPGDLLEHVRDCCEPYGVLWRVVTPGVMSAT